MSAEHDGGWSEERIARMLKMRAAGDSAGMIAKALGGGVSRSAVIGKLHRLKVPAVSERKPSAPGGEVARRIRREGAGRAAVVFGQLPRPSVRPPAEIEAERAAAESRMATLQAGFSADDGQGMPLVGRGRGRCAWPVGVPARPAEQMCCGRPVDGETSWCATHRARALVPLTQKARDYVRNLRRYL